jgi:hypothetical protein
MGEDIERLVEQIRYWHRQRCFAMEQRKRSVLATAAFLRIDLGWNPDLPKKERDVISAKALDMLKPGGVAPEHPMFEMIMASHAARAPFLGVETKATKQMEALAKTLPVWNAWARDVRAFGPRSLAVIVGEAGDIGSYSTHSKLWKRMGLAVINGVRQGGLKKTAKASEWIEHGYNAKRRASSFVIGDCLVKQGAEFREVYLARKEYERAKAIERGLIVAPAAKIPKGQEEHYISDGHIHKRSQRYMEKKLLRRLWQEWRKIGREDMTQPGDADIPPLAMERVNEIAA